MLSRLARRRPLAWSPLAAQIVPFTPLPLATCMVVVRTLAKGKEAKGKETKSKGNASAGAADSSEDGAASGASFTEKDLEDLKQQMDRPFEHLQREYASMQTGRAMPNLLDSVQVDLGNGGNGPHPLPTLAKVLAQGPLALQVSVYEAAHVNAVIKAIDNAPLGLRAEQQGKLIKVNVPRPTQESRQALVKHAKVLAEAAKTAVRGVRQGAMKRAKKDATKEEIKRSEKQIEDLTAKAIAAVDSAIKAKEKELLTV